MLKKHEFLFSVLQKCVDIFACLMGWYLAYAFRFNLLPGGQLGLARTFTKLSLVIVVLTLYFFYRNNLYSSQRFNSRWKEITAILQANSTVAIAFVLLLYFGNEAKVSRIAILFYFFISSICHIFFRLSVRNFLRTLRKKGKNLRHILLVGQGPQLFSYVQTVRKYKDAGISIVGWLDSAALAEKLQIPNLDLSLEEAKKRYTPDAIVIGYPAVMANKLNEVLKESYNDVIPLQVLPDLSYTFIGHNISHFGGLPIISINQPNISLVDSIVKRSFDLLLSLFGLLVLAPLLLLISLLVKLTSRGPIFYGQERVGLDNRKFNMWKFRSMRSDAENKSGAVWCVENDPRRTAVGTFLRKSSLDELPQLWNVFMGDMSLVGPRPERPVFVEQFRDQIPSYMLRHKVKTGITGWAQVNGWRGNTSLEKRIECDIYYIKNWSLWMDIKILFLTMWKGLFNKNAY